MGDGANDAKDRDAQTRDPRWGMCACAGCPLLGTLGRGGDWLCFCHYDTPTSARDLVTATVRRHFAVYRSALDVRAAFGTDAWPRVYREVQQRLLDAGRDDLLPDKRDESPYRPGKPIAQKWLTRLERVLIDAVNAAIRERAKQMQGDSAKPKRPPPSSRDCMARMRATLAPLVAREPTVKWAFDMLDGIAADGADAPPPDAVRIALDAIRSPAGRGYVATATDEQRARWRAALELIGKDAAGLVPSRVPGEDDEALDSEETDDSL